jgi:hypothetical protein
MECSIAEIIDYLNKTKVFLNVLSVEEIKTGRSGAKLFLVVDNGVKYILKNAPHSKDYVKELSFYIFNKEVNLPFAPETLYMENHVYYGILIVMYFYEPIKHNKWDKKLIDKAINLCVQINTFDLNKLGSLNLKYNNIIIDQRLAKQSCEAWKYIINQHNNYFDEKIIDDIYKKIDMICPILNEEPHFFCHGDFHPENVLLRGEELLICDWQNVNIGKGIGEISYFISRALGFGIKLNEDEMIEDYCKKMSEYKKISKFTLIMEKNASTLFTTFLLWPNHLKNNSRERVSLIYNGMVKAFNNIIMN